MLPFIIVVESNEDLKQVVHNIFVFCYMIRSTRVNDLGSRSFGSDTCNRIT